MDGAGKLFDVIRIDHFRGLESYWAVPYGEETARIGRWRPGPGMDLIGALTGWFPNLRLIAEDLGILTPEVEKLREESGLPGMKVLEFAFDPHDLSEYLPHSYPRNCVCYVGTHDNETVMEWLDSADPETAAFARRYLGLSREEGYHWGLIRGGMSSAADTFVVQMQDLLELGGEARINRPNTLGGNWEWRLTADQLKAAPVARLKEITRRYGR